MDYIRATKMEEGYDPNTRHCMYGQDADLIFLSLVTHEPHFALLREEVIFGRSRNGPKAKRFQLLYISVLREYIEAEYAPLASQLVDFEFDLERIIDDWVFLCFLVGNDFLPHQPLLDIGEGARC